MDRRNFLKLLGIGIGIIIGFYVLIKEIFTPKKVSNKKKIVKPTPKETEVSTPTESKKEENQTQLQNSYYKIYIENGIAKALNVAKKSIDFQSSNHIDVIQGALNGLPVRTQKLIISLIGDFIIAGTIKIPSYTIFDLQGSITLANNANQILLQEADPVGGTTQIELNGGTYDGNCNNQSIDNFGINFSKVTNSHFSNLISQKAGKSNFVLDTGCNNNTCDTITGRSGGTGNNVDNGNGLDDRGDHNTWTNCIAEDNVTDNWVIKCRNSTFINCIGRGSVNTTGFGLFGDRNINGNKFMACSGYNNKSNGMTLRIPTKEIGKTQIKIANNFIQGEFYNNDLDGVNFADVTGYDFLSQNSLNVLLHDNNE